jgi:hypothetical protein
VLAAVFRAGADRAGFATMSFAADFVFDALAPFGAARFAFGFSSAGSSSFVAATFVVKTREVVRRTIDAAAMHTAFLEFCDYCSETWT